QLLYFFSLLYLPPIFPLFPYTTLFRSHEVSGTLLHNPFFLRSLINIFILRRREVLTRRKASPELLHLFPASQRHSPALPARKAWVPGKSSARNHPADQIPDIYLHSREPWQSLPPYVLRAGNPFRSW